MAFFITTFHFLLLLGSTSLYAAHPNPCRSFCGNLTLDYPFALHPGCGHPAFRQLLYCINDVLMLHITSGSYRVLDIDYPYTSIVLHDPHMSTCDSIVLGARGNGFVIEPWRAPYMNPTPENAFMLLACSSQSPIFHGKLPPCRNVSGLGCEQYYGCPAWDAIPTGSGEAEYGSGPPDCCSVSYESIKSVNLSKLDCQGYSSAYSLAPLRVSSPGEWAYGIQVKYSVEGSENFCRACEATGGACGYDVHKNSDLCMCAGWNSTTNCDSVQSGAAAYRKDRIAVSIGVIMGAILWRFVC